MPQKDAAVHARRRRRGQMDRGRRGVAELGAEVVALADRSCLMMVAVVPSRTFNSLSALLSIRLNWTFSLRRLSPPAAVGAPEQIELRALADLGRGGVRHGGSRFPRCSIVPWRGGGVPLGVIRRGFARSRGCPRRRMFTRCSGRRLSRAGGSAEPHNGGACEPDSPQAKTQERTWMGKMTQEKNHDGLKR